MQLATQLKKCLKEHDITVAKLARIAKVPKQTIADWLTGTEPRKLTQVKRVATALGVSVDQLVFGINHDAGAAHPQAVRATKGDHSGAGEDGSRSLAAMINQLPDGWVAGVFEVRLRPIKRADE